MKTLTVITTTYNRDYCLGQVYDSLVRQENNDFIWLIMDDGSSDNTKSLVDSWIAENKIEIEYYYKENGGMHTARNAAYEKLHTEINVIIDSDDWMADGAVEKIITFWNENKRDDIAGMICQNADPNGNIIGSPMPKGIKECKFREFFGKLGGKGDKKLVYRSDLIKLNPFPEFEGEKFYPASYKYILLDQEYKMLICDEVVCIVDYNPDSMTFGKFKQYQTCANGFAHFRNETSKVSNEPKYILNQMLHYIAECKYAGIKHPIKNAHRKFYAALMLIPGNLFYIYLNKTKRKY
ncbi:MAG TPA: glycosyltransferase family 2 protein [Clostridiales bacterium]|nr:glycosyltransferase family 2 protein [Clostridiales bacterium]